MVSGSGKLVEPEPAGMGAGQKTRVVAGLMRWGSIRDPALLEITFPQRENFGPDPGDSSQPLRASNLMLIASVILYMVATIAVGVYAA